MITLHSSVQINFITHQTTAQITDNLILKDAVL